MKKVKDKLGHILAAHKQLMRESLLRYELDAVERLGLPRPDPSVSDGDDAAVDAMFACAKERLTSCAHSFPGLEADVTLGTLTLPGDGMVEHLSAIEAVVRTCWPLTPGEGLQLPTNPFHEDWRELCEWANGEDALLEFETRTNLRTVKTSFVIRLSPRKGWLLR